MALRITWQLARMTDLVNGPKTVIDGEQIVDTPAAARLFVRQKADDFNLADIYKARITIMKV